MSLTVGELFVNLGIKGGDKTVGTISSIKGGLGEVKSMSLETKAALIGTMYALERLFAASGTMGTTLTNFGAFTGLQAKQLQQWQFAARQAGVANEEFAGSLKAVQGSMTNMLLGKGAPEGLALLANKVGFDPEKARDTFYVMEQLQKFAKAMPADVGNSVIKSFGISEGVIAAMRRNAFTATQFSKAPTYSDNEIRALDRANIAWSNLGNKVEMAVGHFNARHGGQLVSDISTIITQVVKLAEAFTTLAEKLKIFQALGKVFEGWALIFQSTSELVDKIQGKDTGPSKLSPDEKLRRDKALASARGTHESVDNFFRATGALPSKEEMAKNLKLKQKGITLSNPFPEGSFLNRKELPKNGAEIGQSVMTPRVPHLPSQKPAQDINVHQTLNFQHDGKDHKRTGDSVKKANQDAFRQFNQGQVS